MNDCLPKDNAQSRIGVPTEGTGGTLRSAGQALPVGLGGWSTEEAWIGLVWVAN